MLLKFLTIGLIQLLAVASPGPDFAIVVTNSLSHSRKIGIFTALGIVLGVMIHMSYCVLGFSVLIEHSPFLLNAIKYLGAAYLAYIGINAILEKRSDNNIATDKKEPAHSTWQALRSGFLCNLLNPKAILYFIALFTFISKTEHSIMLQIAFCCEIILIGFAWFSFLAIILTHHKIQNFLQQVQHIITRSLGVILVLLAMVVVFAR